MRTSFNIAAERPFHRKLNVNNNVSIVAAAKKPLIGGIDVFRGIATHISHYGGYLGSAIPVNVRSESAYWIASYLSI